MQAPAFGPARVSAYYDSIAEDYDRELDDAANRTIRQGFWQCAETVLPKYARILDFGAGSGLDAQHFAALGHHVTAYDASDRMLETLRTRCAKEIDDGRVIAISGPLDQARSSLAAQAPFDAILSNFAVFSTVPRLGELFRLVGQLAAPGAVVLAAIQNPWFPPHLRTRSFWRALIGMPLSGTMRYPSAQLGAVFHYRPGQVYRAAWPFFAPGPSPNREICRSCFGLRSKMRLISLRRR